ncbi:MAG TPA: hypothetical protein VHO69_19305, partial [Phototrophicaceae bacterium]|nr:hypothetical protein [Phototrophicaceae bacterium]
HTLRLIRELLSAQPQKRGTNLSLALQTVNRLLKRRAIVFLISDFLLPGATYAVDLALLARRHDVVAVLLGDPLEKNWPDVGLLAVQDAETGTVNWIDTTPVSWREGFQRQAQSFHEQRNAVLVGAGVDRIEVPSDGDYVQALVQFFRQRARRLGR